MVSPSHVLEKSIENWKYIFGELSTSFISRYNKKPRSYLFVFIPGFFFVSLAGMSSGSSKSAKAFPPFRVGIGYDIHRMSAGLRCILGGVEIPSEIGCVAHSVGNVDVA